MKMKKRLLSLLLAVALCIGVVPYTASTAQAAGVSDGKMELTVNQSKVAFAGYEWWVIGDENSGIYPESGSITLLAKNKTIYSNDFKNTQFGVENSNYSGSVLQNKMEEIANSFPEKEQVLINLRTLQGGGTSKNPSVDGIAGDTVSGQKLWALSESERSAINDINVQKYNFAFWLRSPSGDKWAQMGNASGTITGLVPFGDVTRSDVSIRPALSLNLSSALFTSSIGENGKSSATVGSNLVVAETPVDTVKFTMKDSGQTLNINSITKNGNVLYVSYSDATKGTSQYVSCILTDSSGAVKYYGKLADSSSSASGTLSIPLSGVADGNYTLQIFSEEANADLYTDFCSEPVTMTLNVSGGIGTVSNFDKIHEHNWSTEWSKDGAAHWHECTAADCPITNDSDKNGYAEHTYDQEVVDDTYKAVDADCTNAATYYYSCVCGAKGTNIFTSGDALGHDWGEPVWSWSDDGKTAAAAFTCKNDSGHVKTREAAVTSEVKTPATCTENGAAVYTAAVTLDGNEYTDTKNVETAPLGHKAEKTEGNAPTATEPGNIEYWYCPQCDTYFKDADLTEAITKKQTVLAPTGETKPEPSKPDKPDSDSPQTGDNSNLFIWVAVMLMAGAGMAGTIVYSRKKKHSR